MKRVIALTCLGLAINAAAQPVDLSGDWVIQSSVGGVTPITVYCSLQQEGGRLSGTCTPEMENAQSSELSGRVGEGTADWGYDVVFNGEPGRVDFSADEIGSGEMSGTLSLSGTTASFTASREGGP